MTIKEMQSALENYISTGVYGYPHISWVIEDAKKVPELLTLAQQAGDLLAQREPIPELVWNDDGNTYITY